MEPRQLLRLEGLAVSATALGAFVAIDGRFRLLLVLALPPDPTMLGYPAGPRVGSLVYDAAHAYVAPLALAAVSVLTAVPLATSVALVWTGDIGGDRAVGYGLEYPTGFAGTHLGSADDRRERDPHRCRDRSRGRRVDA
jgi:hypothetical protein